MEDRTMTTQLAERPYTQADTDTPRIYVACLASYNAGELHGVWVDVPEDVESLHAAIQEMLAASPEPDAEEWAIHDYEGFGSVHLEEYASLEHVVETAAFIQEHGELASELIAHFAGDIEEASHAIEEHYAGCYDSLETFAEELMEDSGQLASVPENLRNYIDFEAIASDMDLNGDVFTLEIGYKEVHVFWNH
jgi:antirestriction protein